MWTPLDDDEKGLALTETLDDDEKGVGIVDTLGRMQEVGTVDIVDGTPSNPSQSVITEADVARGTDHWWSIE